MGKFFTNDNEYLEEYVSGYAKYQMPIFKRNRSGLICRHPIHDSHYNRGIYSSAMRGRM